MPLLSLIPFMVAAQTPVAQGLDTAVTYTHPAQSVGLVLADISKATNIHLSAKAEAAREVVLLSVSALPLKNLMDKIAFVTSCKWEQGGDGYTLVPNEVTRRREESEEVDFRLKKINKSIKDKIDQAQKQEAAAAKAAEASKGKDSKESDGGDSEDHFMGGSDPDEKVILQLLQMVDPSVLAQVKDGTRAVWATNNPTGMQLTMNGDAAPIITGWIAQHNATIPPADAHAENDVTDQAKLPPAVRAMMDKQMKPVTEPVSKAILVAERGSFIGGFQIHLKAYDSKGKVLLTGTSALDGGILERFQNVQKEAASGAGSKSTGTKTPIDFSDDSKELNQTLSVRLGQAGSGPKLTPELRAKMLHPEQYEPLGWVASDVWLSVAKKENRQLVADLPDDTFGATFITGTSNFKDVEDAEAALSKGDSVRGTNDGQFLLIRPAHPETARSDRVDRGALRTLLQSVENKMIPGLDDVADFAVGNVDPSENSISMGYISLFCPAVVTGSMMSGGDTGWQVYRIFGTLEPSQRQELRNGGSIPFANLTGPQQTVVSIYLFGPSATIQADSAVKPDLVSTMMAKFSGMSDDYRDEPTEVMPSGLPASGVLTCGVVNEPILLVAEGDGMLSNMSLGPQEMALFKMVSSMGGGAAEASGFKLPKEGLIGDRQKLSLSFHLAPKLSAMAELTDPMVDKNAARVSFANLPADFQARVDAESQALKKSPMGSMMDFKPPKEVVPPK